MAGREDSGRAAILGSIRSSLNRPPLSAPARRELDDRIAEPPVNVVPAQARGEPAELIDRFREMAEEAACSVVTVADPSAVPAAVMDYLRANNLPTAVAMAPDPELQALDWDSQPLLERHSGRPRNDDLAGLTPAFAAVAETGTLVMLSDAGHPATLNFMPDHHLVVLKRSQIVGGYEEVWAALRKARKAGDGYTMPRTVNMITGPSRTGDIELTIHLGAHGPRSLHIILVDDETQD